MKTNTITHSYQISFIWISLVIIVINCSGQTSFKVTLTAKNSDWICLALLRKLHLAARSAMFYEPQATMSVLHGDLQILSDACMIDIQHNKIIAVVHYSSSTIDIIQRINFYKAWLMLFPINLVRVQANPTYILLSFCCCLVWLPFLIWFQSILTQNDERTEMMQDRWVNLVSSSPTVHTSHIV